MTGDSLKNFITSLNGGNTIEDDLLNILVDNAKTIIEEERPWTVLRKTDTSKSVNTNYTWQTAIDIKTITDFSRFFADNGKQIVLFDGDNRTEYYSLVPFDRRLDYKDISNTFVYDENSGLIYLNGVIPFAGTLYINYIAISPDIDLTEDTDDIWTPFPKRFGALLGYYAIGVFKGAVDYDEINARMVPENRIIMTSLKNSLEKWDNERQASALDTNDPTDSYDYGFRSGKINR